MPLMRVQGSISQPIVWRCLLLSLLCSAFLLQLRSQTNGDSDFKSIIGEVKRGQVFRKSLGRQITFELKPLDEKRDGRIGVYISVFNNQNPKGHKFVLLPKINSDGDANWVGVKVNGGGECKRATLRT